MVKQLNRWGEIPLENVFMDGTKIQANANRYTFVWKKTVDRNKAKMQEKVKQLIDEMNQHLSSCGFWDKKMKKITKQLKQLKYGGRMTITLTEKSFRSVA